jgi:hypothetical protein
MKSVPRLWLPTGVEAILLPSLSAMILIVMNLPLIGDYFVDPAAARLSVSIVDRSLADFFAVVNGLPVTGALALAVFWGSLGMLLYIIAYSAHEAYGEIRQELAGQSEYHHPRYYRPGRWLLLSLARIAVRSAALAGLIALTFCSVTFGLPLSVQLVRDVTYVGVRPLFALNPLLGVGLTTLTLYLFIVLSRTLMLRSRLGKTTDTEA